MREALNSTDSTIEPGIGGAWDAVTSADALHALWLSLIVALVATVLNTVFGIVCALWVVRRGGRVARVVEAFLDIPLALSPVVVGLALLLVYNGRTGWFGPTLEANGFQVMFALPSMVMATCFVSLPLVIREVVPVLTEIGDDQEQAARSLGAGAVQTLRRITLPAIKWAVVYGVVLTFARSIGEYGALKIVSGNLIGQTQNAPLALAGLYDNFQKGEAYAVAFTLVLLAVLCIVIVSLLRPKESSS